MITEQDIRNYMAERLKEITAEGYSTLDIDAHTIGAVHFQGYNEHSGVHRGQSLDEIIVKINAASKPLHELFMDTATKLRAEADSIEAKANALLAEETPTLI